MIWDHRVDPGPERTYRGSVMRCGGPLFLLKTPEGQLLDGADIVTGWDDECELEITVRRVRKVPR